MSPFLKKFLLLVLVLVGGLAAVLVFIAATFDPNDYKDDIQLAVNGETGRDLILGGPLELSVFPWLGVSASEVSLSNAQGFDDPHFAAIERLEARLRLLPLLKGKVELGLIVLDGLQVNLQRKADGSSNWDDLAKSDDDEAVEADSEGSSGEPGSSDIELRAAGLALSNARIVWRDGEDVTVIDGLNLRTAELALGEPSELKLDVAVKLADDTKLTLDLQTDWQVRLEGPLASLSNFTAKLDASGPAVPAQQQSLELALNAVYDAAKQLASIDGGELRMAGESINFAVQVSDLEVAQLSSVSVSAVGLNLARVAETLALELPPEASNWPELSLEMNTAVKLAEQTLDSGQLNLSFGSVRAKLNASIDNFSNPTGQAELDLAAFDLHAFLTELGYSLAQKSSAGLTSVNARIKLAPDSMSVAPIRGQLAGEALSGTISVTNFKAPAIRADLDLAGVNLADWSGEDAGKTESTSSSKEPSDQELDEIEVPMDWARDLNLTARAAISRMNAYGVKFRDVRWSADARPGKPVRQELSANAYGGQMTLNNQIDPNQPEPVIGTKMSAQAVGLGDFLQDGWGKRWISGTTQLGLNLTTKGGTVGQMRNTANGDANYRLQDGEVQGVSLVDIIRQAESLVSGAKPKVANDSTAFSELVGQFLIDAGRLKLGKMAADNEWFQLAGDGVVDLLAGRFNMTLTPTLRDNTKIRQDKNLSRLIGLALPISVSGPLTAPKFKLDLETALKQKAKQEVDKEIDKQKDKLRDKLNDKLGDFLRLQ